MFTFLCGGLNVSDNLFWGLKLKLLQAYFGAHDTCKKDGTDSQVVEAKNILVHPGYSPASLSNDIALLRLPRDLRLRGKVRRVNLPPEPALAGCQLPQYDPQQLKLEREQCATGVDRISYFLYNNKVYTDIIYTDILYTNIGYTDTFYTDILYTDILYTYILYTVYFLYWHFLNWQKKLAEIEITIIICWLR